MKVHLTHDHYATSVEAVLRRPKHERYIRVSLLTLNAVALVVGLVALFGFEWPWCWIVGGLCIAAQLTLVYLEQKHAQRARQRRVYETTRDVVIPGGSVVPAGTAFAHLPDDTDTEEGALHGEAEPPHRN